MLTERQKYDRQYNQQHKEERREYDRKYKQQHREEILAKKRQYYKANKARLNALSKEKYQQYKLEVLSYYSVKSYPICARCEVTDMDVLCIDHINGGGHKHRTKIGCWGICSWLKRNNYPEGYQVLCANCNLKKHIREGK